MKRVQVGEENGVRGKRAIKWFHVSVEISAHFQFWQFLGYSYTASILFCSLSRSQVSLL